MSALLDSLLDAAADDALRDAAGLGPARRAALDALRRDGLPAARSEAWKYTSLRALERRRFGASVVLPEVELARSALPPGPRLAFVNGIFAPALSDLASLPEAVSLQPLSQALASDDPRETSFLGRRYERRDEAFARLNAGLATEGALLRVAPDATIEAPIHLLLLGASGDDVAWHLRHLIELRSGASLRVVEHRFALGPHAHLSNDIVHVHLARGARLEHVRIQHESDAAILVQRTEAVLAGGSAYRRVDLELGAALSRHELDIALQGAHARVDAGGVLLASGRRQVDTRLGVDHLAADTHSRLLWRGLGAGRGRAVFHGGIVIRAGADRSEAMLANKNLLLSEGAEIDTQPVLEIHADEVKAAHGATVGRLDAQALFYLRSRGVPLAEARAMLTAAFCREVLAGLDDASLVEALGARLDAALTALEPAA